MIHNKPRLQIRSTDDADSLFDTRHNKIVTIDGEDRFSYILPIHRIGDFVNLYIFKNFDDTMMLVENVAGTLVVFSYEGDCRFNSVERLNYGYTSIRLKDSSRYLLINKEGEEVEINGQKYFDSISQPSPRKDNKYFICYGENDVWSDVWTYLEVDLITLQFHLYKSSKKGGFYRVYNKTKKPLDN